MFLFIMLRSPENMPSHTHHESLGTTGVFVEGLNVGLFFLTFECLIQYQGGK